MFLNISDYMISSGCNAREALQRLDYLSNRDSMTLFVIDDSRKLLGTITDGDIRRGLLAGREISDGVESYMNRKFRFLTEGEISTASIKRFKSLEIYLLPVLDANGRLVKIIDAKGISSVIPASAFIMAGGRGERLRPLTDGAPKPMLKVGGKPILEYNIDRLIKFGVNQVFISIRYMGQLIKDYFGSGNWKGIDIEYIEEIEPLGTIGAIALAEKVQNQALLVMNSDILTTIDFADFYQCFEQTNADMCVASVPYNVKIPYGVLELDENQILSLREKPTYVYYSNAGIYLLKSSVRFSVPRNKKYNATDLMIDLLNAKNKVINFPMLNYWLDIGNQEDFMKAQLDIRHLDL